MAPPTADAAIALGRAVRRRDRRPRLGPRRFLLRPDREHEPNGWYLVEQLAYATPGEGCFTRMNLACSGFRPVSG